MNDIVSYLIAGMIGGFVGSFIKFKRSGVEGHADEDNTRGERKGSDSLKPLVTDSGNQAPPPRSHLVGPGIYEIGWGSDGKMYVLEWDVIPHTRENWVQVDSYGFFEGRTLKDVRFVNLAKEIEAFRTSMYKKMDDAMKGVK